jgi:hypothetical protein
MMERTQAKLGLGRVLGVLELEDAPIRSPTARSTACQAAMLASRLTTALGSRSSVRLEMEDVGQAATNSGFAHGRREQVVQPVDSSSWPSAVFGRDSALRPAPGATGLDGFDEAVALEDWLMAW